MWPLTSNFKSFELTELVLDVRLPLQVQQLGDRPAGTRHHRHLLGFIHHHRPDPHDGLAQDARQHQQHLPARLDEVPV